MKIIGISGKMQNGKDTFAEALKAEIHFKGEQAIVFHFADFLKYICSEYFGWDGKKDATGRKLLQTIGTSVFRKNNPTCWTDMAYAFIKGLGDVVDYVIIADVRFKQEANWIRDSFENSTIIRVNRPGYDSGATEEAKKHISEVDLDDYKFDEVFLNEGTLEEYKEKAKAYYEKIK